MPKSQAVDLSYFRLEHLPHIWCAGCGHGIIAGAILRAISDLGLDKNDVVVTSGIGCSSRLPGYLDFDTLHTTHGRAIAFATGVKLANPELTVIVVGGDGDLAAIGGNHLVHAARRNIDLTAICFNNHIYGMTSGQYSPTTPFGRWGSTAPYGNLEHPFDMCALAVAAGATYVARGTTYHANRLPALIKKAINNRGFSFVDVISGCPTYYGRRNDMRTPKAMLEWQRDNAIPISKAKDMSPDELEDKYVIGEFVERTRPEYCEEHRRLIERLQGEAA